jgi:hypothetical protein
MGTNEKKVYFEEGIVRLKAPPTLLNKQKYTHMRCWLFVYHTLRA